MVGAVGAELDPWPNNPFTNVVMANDGALGNFTYALRAAADYTLLGVTTAGDFVVR